MSTPFDGFCGASYALDNRYAGIERTRNWYTLVNESAEEKKFKVALSPCPGNIQFGPLPVPVPFNQPNRGLIEYRGLVYGVNGSVVFTMFPEASGGGAYFNLGTIDNDGLPVSMVGNGNGQIGIVSGPHGNLWVIQGAGTDGPVLVPVPVSAGNFLGGSFITAQDGYLLAVVPGSNKFQISGTDTTPVGDMRLWDPANVSIQAGQADLLSAILSSREYMRLFGQRRSQVYYNAGSNGAGGFPFQSYNETFIETGIAAPFSLAEFEDALVWIGQDSRGIRACWKDQAFQPQRVSDFAVEQEWATYPTLADAIAFPMIWRGQRIYQVTFPTANKTWWYNDTASMLLGRPVWTERTFTSSSGVVGARPERFHCFAGGFHLVGSNGADGNPGAIYRYGVNQDPYAYTGAANPQWLLRWSNDGGNTFGPEYQLSATQPGQYTRRVYYNRCGYARDRVFWLRSASTYFGTDCAIAIDATQTQVPIVRDRICPHQWAGNKRIIYNRIEFEVARGAAIDGIVGAELDTIVCAS